MMQIFSLFTFYVEITFIKLSIKSDYCLFPYVSFA